MAENVPDIVEYMASFSSANGNSSTSNHDSDCSTDTADEIEFVKELKKDLNTHQCDLCCEGTFVINKLMRFGGVLDEGKKYFCNICDKGFKSTSGRSKHIRKIHLQENSGGLSFEVILDGSEGNNSVQSPVFPCDQCDHNFRAKSGLKSHKKWKHSRILTNHLCELCRLTFTDFQEFTEHCIAHTKSSKKLISCPTCNKKFLTKALKEHVCTHHS